MINIGLTLLYVFFSVVQIYIFLIAGVICYFKNVLSPKGIKIINQLLYVLIIPVYSIVEISRMATLENVKIYWILAISMTLAILLRWIIAIIVSFLIKTDYRTKNSFSIMNSYPAVGPLTLVMSKAMCYPGCPMHNDPLCEEVLGLMMVNYLIYSIMIFGFGFIIHLREYKKYKDINYKLMYVWYRLIYIMYIKDKKLDINSKKCLINNQKQLINNDYIAKQLIFKHIINFKKANELYKKFSSNIYLEVSVKFEYNIICTEEYKYILDKIKKLEDNCKSCTTIRNKNFLTSINLNKEKYSSQIINNIYKPKCNSEVINYFKILKYLIKKTIVNLSNDNINSNMNYNAIIIVNNPIDLKMYNLERDFNEINDNILKDIFCFESINTLKIDKKTSELINQLYNNFKSLNKYNCNFKLNSESKHTKEPLELLNITNIIIQKLISPPILGSIIGIFIGMSSLRDILFSKIHYLNNSFEVFIIVGKGYVPLLLLLTGYTTITSPKKFNNNLTLSKLDFYLTFIMSYVLNPIVGYGLLYFLTYAYGNIVEKSIVFKFCVYCPFFVPIGPTFIIVINALNSFYNEEYSYCLSRHFYFLFISSTILVLIFFIIAL